MWTQGKNHLIYQERLWSLEHNNRAMASFSVEFLSGWLLLALRFLYSCLGHRVDLQDCHFCSTFALQSCKQRQQGPRSQLSHKSHSVTCGSRCWDPKRVMPSKWNQFRSETGKTEYFPHPPLAVADTTIPSPQLKYREQ